MRVRVTSSSSTWLMLLAVFVAAGVIAWWRVGDQVTAEPAPREAEPVETSDFVEVEIVEQ